jgi:hypothetical protein
MKTKLTAALAFTTAHAQNTTPENVKTRIGELPIEVLRFWPENERSASLGKRNTN